MTENGASSLKKKITWRIPATLHAQLEAMWVETGVSMTRLASFAIEQLLDEFKANRDGTLKKIAHLPRWT